MPDIAGIVDRGYGIAEAQGHAETERAGLIDRFIQLEFNQVQPEAVASEAERLRDCTARIGAGISRMIGVVSVVDVGQPGEIHTAEDADDASQRIRRRRRCLRGFGGVGGFGGVRGLAPSAV